MFSVQAMAGAQSPFSSMDPNRQQQAASYQGESCDTNWRTGSCFKKYLKNVYPISLMLLKMEKAQS